MKLSKKCFETFTETSSQFQKADISYPYPRHTTQRQVSPPSQNLKQKSYPLPPSQRKLTPIQPQFFIPPPLVTPAPNLNLNEMWFNAHSREKNRNQDAVSHLYINQIPTETAVKHLPLISC